MTYSEIDKITSKIKEIAQEILLKKPLRYSELDEIPSTQGIYLIYRDNKVIYVGKAKVLRRRLKSDHISGEKKITTSTFRRKLTKEPYNLRTEGNEMLNWIKNNCSFCWVEIENSDICHLTEALIISVLRERTEPLLNS